MIQINSNNYSHWASLGFFCLKNLREVKWFTLEVSLGFDTS